MNQSPTKLLLVDDHQIVLDGLASLIEDFDDFKIVATACNGEEALRVLET